jgi:NAD(P)H-nitrite reductase large subunit
MNDDKEKLIHPPQDEEPGESSTEHSLSVEEKTKKLLTVVCICKGINLGRVLKGIEGCKTVEDVNQKVGTGSGGCKGQRCSPRIKILLKKIAERGS